MEAHYEQQKAKKKQKCLMSQAAKERNAQILKVVCIIGYIYCIYMIMQYSKQAHASQT